MMGQLIINIHVKLNIKYIMAAVHSFLVMTGFVHLICFLSVFLGIAESQILEWHGLPQYRHRNCHGSVEFAAAVAVAVAAAAVAFLLSWTAVRSVHHCSSKLLSPFLANAFQPVQFSAHCDAMLVLMQSLNHLQDLRWCLFPPDNS
eukprot:TRINITY_DN15173_c0_g2_i1.p1 TRINITY_DN15173_c0_g2~~TRINITY_DN15173_c0_g2_i1.p1  ORF type:complete len:146 (+),score=15.59 TRINITY_DN15173_c0_g2_i1:40-477(+)